MDEITRAVRELYEAYPYPSGTPVLRTGFDVRRLLSHARLSRNAGSQLQVLDAGCSRAVGLIASASVQPDVEFLGVDINRVALTEAREATNRRELCNLRFQEVDLMTLEGLEAPAGGFDVIHSSGVNHHLSDPVQGLRNLKSLLAPHGVITFMVYGKSGRGPMESVSRAIDALVGRDEDLSRRLHVGRELVRCLAKAPAAAELWKEAQSVDDIEFVDRYLHVNEISYDVRGLWDLIEAAGLAFLRWNAPQEWSLEEQIPAGSIRELAQLLLPLERYSLLEEVRRPRKLELCLCHPENGVRSEPELEEIADTAFAVNPEISFETHTRGLWGARRVEGVAVRRFPGEEPTFLTGGPLALAGLALIEQQEPFFGAALIEVLVQQGVPKSEARSSLLALLRREVIYAPHPVELASATV